MINTKNFVFDDQDDDQDEKIRPHGSNSSHDGAVTVTSGSGEGRFTIHCMTIIGQVEGHFLLPEAQKSTKYEHVIPALFAVEENPEIDALLLLLNTVGGDVEAGLAIAELISSMKKTTATLVLGGGHSIGVPLAVSAGRSFIVPSATMTLHPVRMNGLMIGAPQTYTFLRRMQDRIIRFVTSHSRLPEARMRELIMSTDEIATDMGSVLEGEEAVSEGLIDQVGGLSEALEYLKGTKERKN